MYELDYFHSAILEGIWQGLTASEIAQSVGDDPMVIAGIMDSMRENGYA